ncbi:hypothetical protein COP2_039593 [Malus domestica]
MFHIGNVKSQSISCYFPTSFTEPPPKKSSPAFILHFAPKIDEVLADGVLTPYNEELNRGFWGHHGSNPALWRPLPSITMTNRLLPSLGTKPKQWWRRRSEYGGRVEAYHF